MRIARDDVPVKIEVPGAIARQKTGFGDSSGYGKISGEYFSFGAGTDITPLLHGLEGDLCQCPHWGYVIKGALTTTYTNGEQETVREKDLFYWPPGHTVKADEEADIVLFSPQKEHTQVIDHILGMING
ncbi:MAG: cupin domain-containing protein [Candidatus Eisenbacteria bacterium]|uniref:Cupin domain-containing protein n=1 Tax=Eiseniibacteriota bacterium TaxID=2212470 RepID=A0A948RYB4_UNCEI|nr:cupin domain-containing protein [Candidatus Eisenbacteria bacterium]MBU1947278.1 cupin domain-containing protein [Candidatus Eisenbacteria bacterium]MBU2691817.1 cupin domain-containing protein [Candidatus Eisenbacteria bacterium]